MIERKTKKYQAQLAQEKLIRYNLNTAKIRSYVKKKKSQCFTRNEEKMYEHAHGYYIVCLQLLSYSVAMHCERH